MQDDLLQSSDKGNYFLECFQYLLADSAGVVTDCLHARHIGSGEAPTQILVPPLMLAPQMFGPTLTACPSRISNLQHTCMLKEATPCNLIHIPTIIFLFQISLRNQIRRLVQYAPLPDFGPTFNARPPDFQTLQHTCMIKEATPYENVT